jgi:hypothetical protein
MNLKTIFPRRKKKKVSWWNRKPAYIQKPTHQRFIVQPFKQFLKKYFLFLPRPQLFCRQTCAMACKHLNLMLNPQSAKAPNSRLLPLQEILRLWIVPFCLYPAKSRFKKTFSNPLRRQFVKYHTRTISTEALWNVFGIGRTNASIESLKWAVFLPKFYKW